ncbi:putative Endonuclease/exonuclease/phosphatase superfamily [Helianthus annuus]|uniref:uncharacterized protein LOC110931838 n=1 Tax=Helianthus annuus TaxID=4232 RepID=UPI000B909DC0|nr:uncharacterized protein LOC110931838 [Helianthus annuus]KAJ0949340.1 putative Endonuclease/exonuclease/phosphatase superfamily [Helianthus annuus]
MNFMTLNIKGVTGAEKPVWVRKLKREVKFNFLGLQETHQAGLTEATLSRFWDRSPMEVVTLDAVGRSGGLASFWDPGIFSVDSVIKGQRFLVVSGVLRGIMERLNVLNLYAPNDQSGRRELWEAVINLRLQLPGIWVALGDFNDVRQPDERVNSPFDPISTSFFNDFICRAGFLEYRMTGGKFTYISDNSIIKFSKLDKIFVCDLFLKKWPFATLKVLWRGWSDHCPVTLVCEALDFGPIPFKLYNSWIGSKDLEDIVIANINLQSREGKGDVELAKVLKNIKLDIKKWRDRVKVQEEKEVADLNKEAERLEKLAESTNLNAEERKLRVSIRVKLKKLESARIKYLHQKSRLNWIKYGDENTKFFHAVVNLNKSRSRINGLNVNGVWVTEPKVIKENIRRWFKKHFNESIRRRPTFSNLGLPSISAEESETLVMAFSEDENKNSSQGVRWK